MKCCFDSSRANHHIIFSSPHFTKAKRKQTKYRFTMKVMKPFSLASLALAILTLAFVPTKVNSLETDGTFADAPVTVSVVCSGGSTIDWSKLSLAELTLAGNALTSSYNSVHETFDNDDSTLNDLSFHGVGQRRMLEAGENVEWWNRRLAKGM
jgi:hypothetical protein